jgi:hypothetical protein
MPVFEIESAITGDLRLSGEFTAQGYRFSPSTNGFSLIFDVLAESVEEARLQAAVKVQALVDSITFVTGPSLGWVVARITEKPDPQQRSPLTLTATANIGASVYIVLTTTPEGIAPGLEMARRLENHPKRELLTRALHWFARGVADSDKVDKFADWWIALEALADSYEGVDIQPYLCEACGHMINPRPIGGLLRAYLQSFRMNAETDSMSALSAGRAELFHRALESHALDSLGEVGRILKICIQHEINGS